MKDSLHQDSFVMNYAASLHLQTGDFLMHVDTKEIARIERHILNRGLTIVIGDGSKRVVTGDSDTEFRWYNYFPIDHTLRRLMPKAPFIIDAKTFDKEYGQQRRLELDVALHQAKLREPLTRIEAASLVHGDCIQEIGRPFRIFYVSTHTFNSRASSHTLEAWQAGRYAEKIDPDFTKYRPKRDSKTAKRLRPFTSRHAPMTLPEMRCIIPGDTLRNASSSYVYTVTSIEFHAQPSSHVTNNNCVSMIGMELTNAGPELPMSREPEDWVMVGKTLDRLRPIIQENLRTIEPLTLVEAGELRTKDIVVDRKGKHYHCFKSESGYIHIGYGSDTQCHYHWSNPPADVVNFHPIEATRERLRPSKIDEPSLKKAAAEFFHLCHDSYIKANPPFDWVKATEDLKNRHKRAPLTKKEVAKLIDGDRVQRISDDYVFGVTHHEFDTGHNPPQHRHCIRFGFGMGMALYTGIDDPKGYEDFRPVGRARRRLRPLNVMIYPKIEGTFPRFEMTRHRLMDFQMDAYRTLIGADFAKPGAESTVFMAMKDGEPWLYSADVIAKQKRRGNLCLTPDEVMRLHVGDTIEYCGKTFDIEVAFDKNYQLYVYDKGMPRFPVRSVGGTSPGDWGWHLARPTGVTLDRLRPSGVDKLRNDVPLKEDEVKKLIAGDTLKYTRTDDSEVYTIIEIFDRSVRLHRDDVFCGWTGRRDLIGKWTPCGDTAARLRPFKLGKGLVVVQPVLREQEEWHTKTSLIEAERELGVEYRPRRKPSYQPDDSHTAALTIHEARQLWNGDMLMHRTHRTTVEVWIDPQNFDIELRLYGKMTSRVSLSDTKFKWNFYVPVGATLKRLRPQAFTEPGTGS